MPIRLPQARDDARTKVNELEGMLNQSYDNESRISPKIVTLGDSLPQTMRELNQVKEQLGKIQSLLNPLRVVSSDVA